MFGVSSTKIGASLISPIRRASRVQSSSESWPERSTCSGTWASAESSRVTISILLISSEKMALAMLCRTAALRAKSMLAVDLPRPGRPATMISWPGCRPLSSRSRSPKPVGTPVITPSRAPTASISSSVGWSRSARIAKSSLTRRSVTS